MYSLYRAWFGHEESYPRLETLSPPDTLVRVGNEGEYHFVAHRSVLAAHSGYLEALLAASAATASDGPAAAPAGSHEAAPSPLITSITVPSTIGGEAFAPLLNYMYTGRLEVTLDNIYTVLLATHLLHMPGALQQCRAALLRLRAPVVVPPASISPPPSLSPPLPASQQQQQHKQLSSQQQEPQPQPQQTGSSVLRPVPNRLLGPAFCWPQSAASPGHLYPARHLDIPHLPTLPLPASISVLPSSLIHKSSSYGTKERSISPASSSSQTAAGGQQIGDNAGDGGGGGGCSRSPLTSPELMVASSASSVTQRSDEQQPTRGPSPSASNERISIGDESQSQQQQTLQQQQMPRRRRASQQQQQKRSNKSSSSVVSGLPQTPGVVYDVACCDGPVRFHRVLNENYAPGAAQAQATQQEQRHQQQQQQNQRRSLLGQCNGRASSESGSANNCRENDENQLRQQPDLLPASGHLNGNGESRSGGNYTCGYCQHTFKSQYCYRKHARRHLLPTDAENADRHLSQASLSQASSLSPPQQQQPPQLLQQPHNTHCPPEGKKREVRLLDLNVQYYPCKICGSKFPSYYFVHKHRKLCHANVEEPQSRGPNDSNSVDDHLSVKSAQTPTSQQQQQQQPSTSEGMQQPA